MKWRRKGPSLAPQSSLVWLTRARKQEPVSFASSREQIRIPLLVVLLLDHGVLLVLVLGDEIPDVLVGLLELHLVHALALVPVEERLPLVHSAELGGQPLEDALERGGVGHEGARGGIVLGRDLNDGGLLVVGDPLDVVVGVGGLPLLDDLVDLLRAHGATEDQGRRHVLAVIGLDVGEEVPGGVALVGELLHVNQLVSLVLLGGKGGLGNEEEVEAR